MTLTERDLAWFKTESIEINAKNFAGVLSRFIVEGSKVNRVTQSDLQIYSENKPLNEITLQDLMESGTCFFDALYWLSLPSVDRDKPAKPKAGFKVDQAKITRALFANYFLLLTQARPLGAGVKMSNFITNTLGIKDEPAHMHGMLASFELTLMDNRWIRHIKIPDLGVEAKNRVGLGTAGGRLPWALMYTTPNGSFSTGLHSVEDKWPADYAKAKEVRGIIGRWLESGPHWYAHPLFRSNQFINRLKSFNKACSDLLCFLFTSDTLDDMVANKVLFSKPTPNPMNRNWMNWDAKTFDFEPELIFPKED